MNLPIGTFIVGNKLMAVCRDCEKVIRVDKPIFGSLHICLTQEEKQIKQQAELQARLQKNYRDQLHGAGGLND